MTKQFNSFFITIILLLTTSFISICNTFAESTSIEGSGQIDLKSSESSPIQDPENPVIPVEPTEIASSKGDLRIDYASKVSFGKVKISDGEKKLPALAENFITTKQNRGQFVQVTDQRNVSSGWTLQVKQTKQFETKSTKEQKADTLKGAYLSFDKAWANSGGESGSPRVSRDTLAINSFNTTYEVASATKGNGVGIWSIAFGSSDGNESGQPNTLVEKVNNDKKTEIVNSAVTLNIPKETKIVPGEYKTELVWIIGSLPE